MKFRPCIDLHNGKVKQIVGGTLRDDEGSAPAENFVSDLSAQHYAEMYRRDKLTGGHVIKLGPGNEEAARAALAAYPGGLQVGGGVTAANAAEWLERGASHVIVTSWLFDGPALSRGRLDELVAVAGRERVVLDLSCRKRDGDYFVVTDRWQTFTDLKVDRATLEDLGSYCAEFLVHGVDVEGTRVGIENPGYPDARNIFELKSPRVVPLAVDEQGVIPGADMNSCEFVYATPSHQSPTTVTMPLERRELARQVVVGAMRRRQLLLRDTNA